MHRHIEALRPPFDCRQHLKVTDRTRRECARVDHRTDDASRYCLSKSLNNRVKHTVDVTTLSSNLFVGWMHYNWGNEHINLGIVTSRRRHKSDSDGDVPGLQYEL